MSTLLWHDRFIDDWMWALPLGNGRIGAMVYGSPDREVIEINEESLWSGRPLLERSNASKEALAKIRELIFDERLDEAAVLCRDTFLSDPPFVRFFESFGEIFIDFFDKTPVSSYRKELELSEALARVLWEKEGVLYKSESFVSEEYDAFAYRVRAEGGRFSARISMERKRDAYTIMLDPNTLLMKGQISFETSEKYGEGGEGMSFGAGLRVITDGIMEAEHSSVTVRNASYIITYGAFSTNYNVNTFSIDESIDWRGRVLDCLERMIRVPFEEILAKHICDHKKWFNRVSFELDAPKMEDISTYKRLSNVKHLAADDPDLLTLYYNFGRYLLTESSGKRATLPANLQGIWCHDFRPPWGSDYHTNINLQMNYWPAGPCDISDATKPLIHMMKMLSRFGAHTAKEVFGANGWCINHTTDVFGRTGVHDSVDCGFFPMAGPWMCLNLFEHYEYTLDIEYLRDIFPVLKGACEFVCDYLVEDKDGYLVTNPSNSPENEFYYTGADGTRKKSMLTYGASIDFQIIYALFTRVLYACSLLGDDVAFAARLEEVLRRLPPIRVSERYGTICEWIKDYEEVEPGHRHSSHLFGLYPSDQINERDPVIFEAAKKSIKRRIENGGGASGWSRAWIVSFFARLKDGDAALTHLKYMLSHCTAYNLFDIHPPFQIDGNFGGVAGINEMLVQSHLGSPDARIVELLPALPEQWRSGSVRGIRSRGGFKFDIDWSCGKLSTVKISSDTDKKLMIKLNDRAEHIRSTHSFCVNDNVLSIELHAGECAVLEFRAD